MRGDQRNGVRQRLTETERQKQREERWTDRQKQREERWTDRQTDRQTEKDRDR